MEALWIMLAGILFTLLLAVVVVLLGWGVGYVIAEFMWWVTKGERQ